MPDWATDPEMDVSSLSWDDLTPTDKQNVIDHFGGEDGMRAELCERDWEDYCDDDAYESKATEDDGLKGFTLNECPKCKGRKYVDDTWEIPYDTDFMKANTDVDYGEPITCPRCNGSGMVSDVDYGESKAKEFGQTWSEELEEWVNYSFEPTEKYDLEYLKKEGRAYGITDSDNAWQDFWDHWGEMDEIGKSLTGESKASESLEVEAQQWWDSLNSSQRLDHGNMFDTDYEDIDVDNNYNEHNYSGKDYIRGLYTSKFLGNQGIDDDTILSATYDDQPKTLMDTPNVWEPKSDEEYDPVQDEIEDMFRTSSSNYTQKGIKKAMRDEDALNLGDFDSLDEAKVKEDYNENTGTFDYDNEYLDILSKDWKGMDLSELDSFGFRVGKLYDDIVDDIDTIDTTIEWHEKEKEESDDMNYDRDTGDTVRSLKIGRNEADNMKNKMETLMDKIDNRVAKMSGYEAKAKEEIIPDWNFDADDIDLDEEPHDDSDDMYELMRDQRHDEEEEKERKSTETRGEYGYGACGDCKSPVALDSWGDPDESCQVCNKGGDPSRQSLESMHDESALWYDTIPQGKRNKAVGKYEDVDTNLGYDFQLEDGRDLIDAHYTDSFLAKQLDIDKRNARLNYTDNAYGSMFD